jgi:hypothetical protein
MSSATPSQELPKTRKIKQALDQLASSAEDSDVSRAPYTWQRASVQEQPRSRAITHRCRIFQLKPKGLREGMSLYTLVWDSVERPFENKALPRGEVAFEISGTSRQKVQEEAEHYCQNLGRVHITDWHGVGSI